MASISEALQYPKARDEWVKTVVIGGVLSLFGFLLLPILPVYGYLVRAIRHSVNGDSRPPTFDDWETLFVDGAKAFVIGLVYLLIPAIVSAVLLGGSMISLLSGTSSGTAAGLTGLGIGLFATLVLSLVFGYLGVAAVVSFADTGRFGAAFDVSRIKHLAMHRDYVMAWVLSVVVFVGASVVVGLLNAIPVLGTIAGVFVFFYVQIAAARLWGDGYRAAIDGWDVTERADLDESPA